MSLLPPPDMSKSSLSQIITRMAALSTKLSASITEANGSEPIQLRNTPDKMKDIGNNAVIRPSTSRVSTEGLNSNFEPAIKLICIDLKIVDELRNEVSAITENLLQYVSFTTCCWCSLSFIFKQNKASSSITRSQCRWIKSFKFHDCSHKHGINGHSVKFINSYLNSKFNVNRILEFGVDMSSKILIYSQYYDYKCVRVNT